MLDVYWRVGLGDVILCIEYNKIKGNLYLLNKLYVIYM